MYFLQLPKNEMDKYDEDLHDPPSCQILSYVSPDAAQSVQCSLLLEGVPDTVLNFEVPQALGK